MFLTLTFFAALSFSIGGYFMKLSAGFTQLRPTVLVSVLFALGAGLQTLAIAGSKWRSPTSWFWDWRRSPHFLWPCSF
jgi:hypothetical protein